MAWTAPRTWVAGETVTAAIMNTHVRDNLKAIGDAWTPYTPAWTSSGAAPTLGNGSLSGAYRLAGKTCFFRLSFSFGSTSAAGSGDYRWSLPVAAVHSAHGFLLGGRMDNQAVTSYAITAGYLRTTTTFEAIHQTNPFVGAASPFAWGVGDFIQVYGMYEAA